MVRPSARREVVGFYSKPTASASRGPSGRRVPAVEPTLPVAARSAGGAEDAPKDLAAARVRYGYRRLHVLLRREGWVVNRKRVHRLYREEGLSIRPKTPRRKRSCRYRAARPTATAANQVWAMDFMSDQLFDTRPFRILTIVYIHTREALACVPRVNFRAHQVVEELQRLAALRGRPASLRVDNGPEFAGRMLDQWAYLEKVELDFSRPGKPTHNGYIEAFNGRLRAECLNTSWFLSMADARHRIEEWRLSDNHDRPHMALGGLTPASYAKHDQSARKVA
jgi:putative transposase